MLDKVVITSSPVRDGGHQTTAHSTARPITGHTHTAQSADGSTDGLTGRSTDRTAKHSATRKLTQAALWGTIIAALVLFRDRLPDLRVIWYSVRRADPAWLLVVIAAEAASMSAFARLQRRLLNAGGVPISRRRAFAVTYASNALSTTLPAGPAISVVYSFRQFRRSGSSAQIATAVIIIGGVITSTAYTLVALTALLAEPSLRPAALATLAGLSGLMAVLAALAAGALFAGRRAATYARLEAAVRRLVERRPRARELAGQVRDGWRVLRLGPAGWALVASLALLNWIFDIIALIAAGLAVGIEVAPYQVGVAYFAAQAAGSLLPLLPGGLGAIESSMVASLAAFGVAAAPAAAAVGLYRVVSYWAVVAVGWLAWFALRDMSVTAVRLRRRAAGWVAGLARHAWAGLAVYGTVLVPCAACISATSGPASPASHWTGARAATTPPPE